MGQEFFINSQELEDKVRKLLPSQGGAEAGFDLSGSTQIIPIIDLTESAEGSNLRQDLQTALGFNDITVFDVNGSATTTILENTGYWRLFGSVNTRSTDARYARFIINDGATDKIFANYQYYGQASTTPAIIPFDFIIKLEAGHSLVLATQNAQSQIYGCYKQIASISGELT